MSQKRKAGAVETTRRRGPGAAPAVRRNPLGVRAFQPGAGPRAACDISPGGPRAVRRAKLSETQHASETQQPRREKLI